MIDQVPLGELDYDKIAKETGVSPEELVLGLLIEYFGPVSPAFLEHTGDKEWQDVLKELELEVVKGVGEDPTDRFKNWNRRDFPHIVPAVKRLIHEMVKFTPVERLTIHQVLEDPSWDKMV